jgi:hypothetical protein
MSKIPPQAVDAAAGVVETLVELGGGQHAVPFPGR